MLRRKDSNPRPLGYEPNELPLLHSAIFDSAKIPYNLELSKPFPMKCPAFYIFCTFAHHINLQYSYFCKPLDNYEQ